MFLEVFKCCSFCLLPLYISHGTTFSDSHLTASFLEVGALLFDVGTRMLTVAVSLAVVDVLGVKLPRNMHVVYDLWLLSCSENGHNPGHCIGYIQCTPHTCRLCHGH